MLLRPAEFTHASEKFEFTMKEFGASGAGRSLRRCRCPYHFVSWAAVANQLAAAWMWLAGAMPLSTVHSNSLLYFSVILRNPWFSLGNNKCFWKENEKLYCENYWQCFRKNDEGGLFPLRSDEFMILTLFFFHLASKYCHKIVIPTPNWKVVIEHCAGQINISQYQYTLSFLIEKIFDFKVDRCPKF